MFEISDIKIGLDHKPFIIAESERDKPNKTAKSYFSITFSSGKCLSQGPYED